MTNVYILNNLESAAMNLFQFLLDNGCKITLDEEARECLPRYGQKGWDDGWGNAAKAKAYYDAVCEVDGCEVISYKGAGYRGWVQLAIGWGNKEWEEIADYSIPADDDKTSLADIWHDGYQSRIGDKLCDAFVTRDRADQLAMAHLAK